MEALGGQVLHGAANYIPRQQGRGRPGERFRFQELVHIGKLCQHLPDSGALLLDLQSQSWHSGVRFLLHFVLLDILFHFFPADLQDPQVQMQTLVGT